MKKGTKIRLGLVIMALIIISCSGLLTHFASLPPTPPDETKVQMGMDYLNKKPIDPTKSWFRDGVSPANLEVVIEIAKRRNEDFRATMDAFTTLKAAWMIYSPDEIPVLAPPKERMFIHIMPPTEIKPISDTPGYWKDAQGNRYFDKSKEKVRVNP
ncbi:MAG: hypothetical protein WCV92_02185 [Candidatus Buchananbacteria bacterium]